MLRLAQLRAHALMHTFFAPTSLEAAIERLGFVQADPIRAPARAQDLILRQRVAGYVAGALEQSYPALSLDEEYLYAYGFVPRHVAKLLHPRAHAPKLLALDKKVLALIKQAAVHPRSLDEHLGRKRVLNAWGGYSQATKRALERLHQAGLLRIARRESGIRLYERAPSLTSELSPEQRLQRLMMVVANVLAPVRQKTLLRIAARLRRVLPQVVSHTAQLRALLGAGELAHGRCDQVDFVWPVQVPPDDEPPRRVRLLAPFDPLVWDRERFEQLWGWAYRFEAYTPVHKRVRAYYALPLLWREQVIGWASARIQAGALEVDVGYVGARPRERDFARELDAEITRLRDFLALDP